MACAFSLVCAESSNANILLGVIVGILPAVGSLLAVIFLLVFCRASLKGTQKAAKISRKDGAQSTLAQRKWLGCVSLYPPVLCDFSHCGLWLFLKVCIHPAPIAQLGVHTMKSLPLIPN